MSAGRDKDTIAAIATAPGRGGVGVVRISGSGLDKLATLLCEGRVPSPRRAMRCRFRDRTGCVIDDGLLLYFSAPRSYTGEDVIELHGHGGPVVLQMLLSRCLELGARLADPGEFSRRAFLRGKMDLAQAEAVADIIEASTAAAVRSAQRSLAGEFSMEVQALVQGLIDSRMLIEASLDFPEEEIDFAHQEEILEKLRVLCERVAVLLARGRAGRVLRTGLHVVLAGLPNVGKSSLLNRLAGEERAIVTDIAGTTRDSLREEIDVSGIPIHVVDTAGLRDTHDPVERIGVERAWKEIAGADVILLMRDARSGETAGDHAIAVRLPSGVERIVVENKCDLLDSLPVREVRGGLVHLRISAKTGEGVDLLRDELLRVAGWTDHGESVILARSRHIEALEIAAAHLAAAIACGSRLELCAEEARLAQVALSRIVGEFTSDDLLGEIFSRFCIGK